MTELRMYLLLFRLIPRILKSTTKSKNDLSLFKKKKLLIQISSFFKSLSIDYLNTTHSCHVFQWYLNQIIKTTFHHICLIYAFEWRIKKYIIKRWYLLLFISTNSVLYESFIVLLWLGSSSNILRNVFLMLWIRIEN